jgi:hypothetical protein
LICRSREPIPLLDILEDPSKPGLATRNESCGWPVVRIEAHCEQPVSVEAILELWRTNAVPFSKSPQRGGMFEFGGHAVPMDFEADTVLTKANRVTWCHFNSNSIYPLVLKQEHLESLLTKYPDPLLHRCFGASMFGPGLVADGENRLRSRQPSKALRIDILGLTQNPAGSIESWRKGMEASIRQVGATDLNYRLWGNSDGRHTATNANAAAESIGPSPKGLTLARVYRPRFPIITGLADGGPTAADISLTRSSPRVMLPMSVALALSPAKVRWPPPPRPA